MKNGYDVLVERTEVTTNFFTVEADSLADARRQARQAAQDDSWEEQGEVTFKIQSAKKYKRHQGRAI
jgi:hypothetical protein